MDRGGVVRMTGLHPSGDAALDRVVKWFESQDSMTERLAGAIRQSLDEVFDGQRTGRYELRQLSKTEKTYIGTKVEIIVQSTFGLRRGERMDYLVAGEEVDAKWSMRSGGWMIPTEALGELCLCITADDGRSIFSVGIVRAEDGLLRQGGNKDKKRQFTPAGVDVIRWLVLDGALPENLLLHLSDEDRSAILDPELSGQARVNRLFRLVQRRIVRREVVLTVAKQDDGPKRVRDARRLLADQGIVILGHQNDHPRIARAFGLQVPMKGSWISARLVHARAPASAAVEIDGALWRLADDTDPLEQSPARY